MSQRPVFLNTGTDYYKTNEQLMSNVYLINLQNWISYFSSLHQVGHYSRKGDKTGIIFYLLYSLKHMLWVLIGIASLRLFQWVPTRCFGEKITKNNLQNIPFAGSLGSTILSMLESIAITVIYKLISITCNYNGTPWNFIMHGVDYWSWLKAWIEGTPWHLFTGVDSRHRFVAHLGIF